MKTSAVLFFGVLFCIVLGLTGARKKGCAETPRCQESEMTITAHQISEPQVEDDIAVVVEGKSYATGWIPPSEAN